MSRLIDGDTKITALLYNDEHEETERVEMSIADFLDGHTEEGCPQAVGGWISVKDRLPEEVPWDAKYALIWLYVEKEDGRKIKPEAPVIGKYDPFEKTWTVVGLVENMQSRIRITHWMPLPEPPKEEKDAPD